MTFVTVTWEAHTCNISKREAADSSFAGRMNFSNSCIGASTCRVTVTYWSNTRWRHCAREHASSASFKIDFLNWEVLCPGNK